LDKLKRIIIKGIIVASASAADRDFFAWFVFIVAFEDFADGTVGKADFPVSAKFLSQTSESIIGLFKDLDNKIFNMIRGFAGTVMGTAGAVL